ESQVAELSRLLKEKNQQLYIIQEESLAQQSTITCLSEKISSLEKQKQAVDEQLLAYEEMVANLEEEMLKSQKCEEELQKSKVRLESEVKAGQLREEDLKESYATVSQKFLILEENFRKSRDRHRSNIRILQSDMDSLRRELNSARKELESSKEQFEKYKVRAHSVLKQQKQNAAGANTSETSDVESESVIENMKRQIDYLEKQLQMERDATKTARDDCEVMAQKHQHVLLEQKKEWRNRLDEVKQNAKDMAKELRKQLDLQHEKLSAEYQKKLEEKDAEYGQTIEKLKNELGEVQKMSAQAPTAPLQEMAAAGGDFSTLERQAGEGSESVTPPQQPLHQLPWELVPATGATPLETLLESTASVEERSQKTVSHLAEMAESADRKFRREINRRVNASFQLIDSEADVINDTRYVDRDSRNAERESDLPSEACAVDLEDGHRRLCVHDRERPSAHSSIVPETDVPQGHVLISGDACYPSGCSVSVPHDHTDFERRAFHDSSAAASTSATSQIQQLAGLGGSTFGAAARRMLELLLSLEVAVQFSWAGQKGKRKFVDLGVTDVICSE
ncbi:hypothetical protein MRX96_011753, partial [Rhipicephalus microplus]